ncbi:MAG TPA: Gfo/Idh/MocA family oxidoreductase [Chloroflexota bacterium]|jgi:predicted dehydrogenase|nr:Gfo/Idh/MocA family oxidoreductase [Chloroflexota bacterium]
MNDSIRWGIVSTARIAETAFIPALRAAGQRAILVGGRDLARAQVFADRNGVESAVSGYDNVLQSPDVDAVYIPLPNSLHAEWTMRALEAGKAVLCEKPLCVSPEEVERVLATARRTPGPLWEAFVFPYHRQHRRILEIVSAGMIGPLCDITSEFHFNLTSTANIRLAPELAGGALNDVGCYPVRFAQLVFDASPTAATAVAKWSEKDVDLQLEGVLECTEAHRLLISCGMTRDTGTFSRVIGEHGEIRATNPFHARDFDTLEIRTGNEVTVEHVGNHEPTFAPALRHIQAVIRGDEQPRHTALDDSAATGTGLDVLRRSARSGCRELVT